jgi:hypothetical protein
MPREDPTVLDWLRRIFAYDVPRQQASKPEPWGLHVLYDADFSGDAAADPPDLYWLLHGTERRRPLLIRMGLPGEHDLVHAMQVRLDGFDNMAVVEAMSAKGPVGFKIWEAGPGDSH